MTDPARRIQSLESRLEMAEAVADRAIDFHTGTEQWGPLRDALENYAASKGMIPPDLEWDQT